MDKIKSEDSKLNSCIIIDDCTAYLKDNDNLKVMKELIFNRRHLHTSIYFLCQSYISVPRDIRKMFTNLFIFRVSKQELETVFDEVIEQKKEIIDDLRKLVYDKPHQYLFINTDSQRLFKGFDEILLHE
jgi:glutamyl-tRNA reductase